MKHTFYALALIFAVSFLTAAFKHRDPKQVSNLEDSTIFFTQGYYRDYAGIAAMLTDCDNYTPNQKKQAAQWLMQNLRPVQYVPDSVIKKPKK